MDSILEENFKFAATFFDNAISKDKLYHSYLLTGNNNVAKYAFALNIARILNCEGDKSENCQCLNCKWIRNNSHPAVMTFSPIDFIHVNEKGKAQKNISANQARYIKNELAKSSVYHRVIIITNATEGNEAAKGFEQLQKYNIKPPLEAGEESNENRIWMPLSIKQDIFTPAAANTLLKTVEEPFDKVTFFFLANTKEDVIDTIVSRCQVVNIPSAPQVTFDYSLIEKITKNFPAKDTLTSILMAEHIKNISKEYSLSFLEILEIIEHYYSENLKNNLQKIKNYRVILTFLNKLELAKNQLKSKVNEDSVLENLFFI